MSKPAGEGWGHLAGRRRTVAGDEPGHCSRPFPKPFRLSFAQALLECVHLAARLCCMFLCLLLAGS
jgi:hypothetical protein